MLGKKESLQGIDVGSHTVKIVQVNAKNAAVKLQSLGLIPLPADAFVEGRVSKSEGVAKSIQKLCGHLKTKEKQVAASVSGYDVMIKKIEMPMMSENELDKRMQGELGQYIPYNIEEVDVDYQILDISKDRPNYMDVLLVAAKKESVNDYVGLMKLAGFDPRVIDVDFFALSNAFEATYGVSEQNIAVLDIGANKGIMDIIQRGIPVFTRGIPIGGSQITERLRDHFRISYEAAERIKLGEVPESLPARDIEGIFVSVVRNWVNELRRAVDFYYSNFPEARIEKIYLCGGSCRIPGLDKVFQQQIDSEVEIFNPLSRIEYDSKVFDPAYIEYVGPQMAISLGLALRRAKV